MLVLRLLVLVLRLLVLRLLVLVLRLLVLQEPLVLVLLQKRRQCCTAVPQRAVLHQHSI